MSHEAYKNLTVDDLHAMFSDVKFKTKPMHHQLASLAWGLDGRKKIMLWHDIGTGKTLIALYLTRLWRAQKTLVVCPNSVIRTWQEQIEQHTDQGYLVLNGTAKKRQELSKQAAPFHLINYEGLRSLFSQRVEERVGDKKKFRWIPDSELIRQNDYDCLVFDESHHLASPKALQTNIAFALSKLIDKTILMTGTPIASSELDLWAQYYLIDRGASLGDNFYRFQNSYFSRVSFGAYFNYFIKKGCREKILKRITPNTLRYEASECIDLPELIEHQHFIPLSPAHRKVYDSAFGDIREDCLREKKSEQYLITSVQQLVQIAGGFLIDDGEYIRLPGTNAKLDELREILKATASLGRKILVCHCFVEEGRMIEELCRKMKLRYSSMRGEIKNKELNYKRFIDPKGSSVLIFHPRSAGEGLNLQIANHIAFFSFGMLGIVMRQQAIGRIHRAGQKESCVVFDLVAKDTIEEAIYRRLNEKVAVSRILLDHIRGARDA